MGASCLRITVCGPIFGNVADLNPFDNSYVFDNHVHAESKNLLKVVSAQNFKQVVVYALFGS